MAVDLEKLNTNGTDTFNQLISKFNNNMDELFTESENTDDSISQILDSLAKIQTTIRNMVYPVGSIYISTNSANPSSFIGGTWERYGNGKALVGVDENDIDFNIASKTGGEKTHILTENEIPSQSHWIYNNESIGSEPHHVWATEWKNIDPTDIKGACMPFSGGGNEAHNNLPPYITCYMWKRVS